MNPLISVIVPIYNVEKYLERCIDSILGQTYRNLEIILVNDGSLDNCGNICDAYLSKDERIKVIHKENGGISDARNVGIDIAKGELIAFIDSDDWIDSRYFDVLYKLLHSREADISICNLIKTSKEEISLSSYDKKIYEFSNIEALRELYGQFHLQMVVAWAKLYKRYLFEDLRFPYGKVYEDQFMVHELLYRAKKIVLTTEPLIYYWQHEKSITGQGFRPEYQLHYKEALEERIIFLKKKGELDLAARAYRQLFNKYKSINDNKHLFKDVSKIEEFTQAFYKFKGELRKSEQSLMFKIYYESYYKAPNTIRNLHKLYVTLKKKVSPR